MSSYAEGQPPVIYIHGRHRSADRGPWAVRLTFGVRRRHVAESMLGCLSLSGKEERTGAWNQMKQVSASTRPGHRPFMFVESDDDFRPLRQDDLGRVSDESIILAVDPLCANLFGPDSEHFARRLDSHRPAVTDLARLAIDIGPRPVDDDPSDLASRI